jgi:DNA polymerase I-like protein with 3'-5' exonuclease and polymerase domains
MDLTRAISFDVETDGQLVEYALQPWRLNQGKAWLTTAAISYKPTPTTKEERGAFYPTPEWCETVLDLAIAEDRPIVGWNVQFDIQWLIAMGLKDKVFAVHWMDGMLLWRHHSIEPEYEAKGDKRKSYSLKDAVREKLPQYANYEVDVHYHDPDLGQLEALLHYNKIDTRMTYILANFFWSQLNDRQKQVAETEARSIPMVAWANWHGMEVDQEQVKKLQKDMDARAASAFDKLAEHGVTEEVLRSPQKLEKLMFDTWGLEPIKKNSKTGSRSTDKEVLYELAPLDDRAAILRNWREALNLKSKYLTTLEESPRYNEDGKTHPQAKIFGTYTSRITISSTQGKNKEKRQTGFAQHQMKNDKEFRKLIFAPEGYDLGEADASGQEFRWMAIESGDETMLQLCLPGEDPHSYMGAQISAREYEWVMEHKEDEAKGIRKAGKVANLCVAGGTKVLTDRGVCNIEDVKIDDLVWDGEEFVQHDGVQLTGINRDVISYGVTATPEHGVLVNGRWESVEDAARYGWQIEPALGQRWSDIGRAAIRILGGIGRRAFSKVRRSLFQSTMQAGAAALELYRFGVRPYEQRRALRTGKYSIGNEERQLKKQAARVYDIVNCGPRHRFAANGLIVHNSLQYRTSAPKLLTVARVQYNIPMVASEAILIHATYPKTYPGVPKYWKRQIAFGMKYGYAENLAGRRVSVKGEWWGRQKWSMESTLINYPIQSIGGDQKYLALRFLQPYLIQEGIYFAWDLHDGLYFYLPSHKSEKCMRTIKFLLDQLPYKKAWGIIPPIPLTWDVKLAKRSDGLPSWGNLKELTDG